MRSDSPPWADDAMRHLRSADPVLGEIIEHVGPLRLVRRSERFHALARAIIFQQLAGRAALAIYGRFVEKIGDGRFPTPQMVIDATDEALRAAGISRGKAIYLRDLATHVKNGSLNFHRFSRMGDEEIITELTSVKGIGRWTAEMFLMFNLYRPDVLPVGDLGFRNAVEKAYAIRTPLAAKELALMGERWRPYRSAATWYFWQSTRLVTAGNADQARVAKPTRATTTKVKIARVRIVRKTTIRQKARRASPRVI
jgi:DNA-3-methyladenine glycosylase II